MKTEVFINCPFDAQYRDCFGAIIFTCYACGFVPRSALSISGRRTLRYAALKELVDECDVGVHDLSRTQADDDGRPRFNMPFELGFFLGAKEFGGKRHRLKHILVMVRDKHTMGAYLSDLAGLDPAAHGDDPRKVIRYVRATLNQWLSGHGRPRSSRSVTLPGPLRIAAGYQRFKSVLAKIAQARDFEVSTFNILDAHLDFCHAVEVFLTSTMAASQKARI